MSNVSSSKRNPAQMTAGAFIALSLALTGCANNYGANRVDPNAVGVAATIREGVVTSVREVEIGSDNSVVGAGTGAVLGGIAGSEIGGGDKANTAGAVAGAVLGGIIGNRVGTAVTSGKGFAYTVEFSSGEIREIVQGDDIYITPGTAVNVVYREDGTRVVPAN